VHVDFENDFSTNFRVVPTCHVKISVADDVGCVQEDPVDVALAFLSDCALEGTRASQGDSWSAEYITREGGGYGDGDGDEDGDSESESDIDGDKLRQEGNGGRVRCHVLQELTNAQREREHLPTIFCEKVSAVWPYP